MNKKQVLTNMVPHPVPKLKRRFIAISEEDYEFITALAGELDTTRGRIVSALRIFYLTAEEYPS